MHSRTFAQTMKASVNKFEHMDMSLQFKCECMCVCVCESDGCVHTRTCVCMLCELSLCTCMCITYRISYSEKRDLCSASRVHWMSAAFLSAVSVDSVSYPAHTYIYVERLYWRLCCMDIHTSQCPDVRDKSYFIRTHILDKLTN